MEPPPPREDSSSQSLNRDRLEVGRSTNPDDLLRREEVPRSRYGAGNAGNAGNAAVRPSTSSHSLDLNSFRSQADLPPRAMNLDSRESSSSLRDPAGDSVRASESQMREMARRDALGRGFADGGHSSRDADSGDASLRRAESHTRGFGQKPTELSTDDTTTRIERAFEALPATVIGLDCLLVSTEFRYVAFISVWY